MNGSVVAFEVASAHDPMPTLADAWSRGERVLVVARDLPTAVRDEYFATARVSRVLTPVERLASSRMIATASASVIIATSGSAATPRLIEISVDALRTSAMLGARRIPFGPNDVWLASLSPSSIGGLMIHVRAQVLGGTVLHAPSPRCWSDLSGVTHVSLVATQLSRLLEDASAVPPTLKAVMLGGGPSSRALRSRALQRGVPLCATYGMTETASQVATGVVSLDDAATFAGAPLDGVEISIDANTSEVLVNSPTLARGLLREGSIIPFTQPFSTQDVGHFDKHGNLHIHGRLDAMFISGGRNIHPETIERALGELPCVRAACVVAIPHEKWGMRPIAFVELSAAPQIPLAAQLRDRLESYLVPDAFLLMPADECLRMKPSRRALCARVQRGEQFTEVA